MKEKRDLDCQEVKEKLPHYIANELPIDEAIRVGEHLLQCNSCRAFLGELEEVRKSLEVSPVELPGSIKEELKLRIMAEQKERKQQSRTWFFKPLPLYRVAIAALMFFLLGVGSTWLFFSVKKSSSRWKYIKTPAIIDSSFTTFSVAESRFFPNAGKM